MDFFETVALRYQYLLDKTGTNSASIPIDDPKVIEIFRECNTDGIPEFHTDFAKKVLKIGRPNTFNDLMKVYGLTHGTGVWKDNAEILLKNNICTLQEIIISKEDVYQFLINIGINDKTACETAEKVQNGTIAKTGDTAWLAALQAQYRLPSWWIDSISKIWYMYPLTKTIDHVQTALRLAWFKVYYPDAFSVSNAIDKNTEEKLWL